VALSPYPAGRYAVRQDGTLRYSEFALAIRSGELAARHGISEWADKELQVHLRPQPYTLNSETYIWTLNPEPQNLNHEP